MSLTVIQGCLAIVKPELIDVEHDTKEKWPKQPLIVTGSRDHELDFLEC